MTSRNVDKVNKHYKGRDPIKEAQTRMKQMPNEELCKLILIAANRIGLLTKGKDYTDPADAAIHLCEGIDLILATYDSASMGYRATTNEVGTA